MKHLLPLVLVLVGCSQEHRIWIYEIEKVDTLIDTIYILEGSCMPAVVQTGIDSFYVKKGTLYYTGRPLVDVGYNPRGESENGDLELFIIGRWEMDDYHVRITQYWWIIGQGDKYGTRIYPRYHPKGEIIDHHTVYRKNKAWIEQ